MWSVLFGVTSYSERVVEVDVRCLPACTRRRSDSGRFVRRARSVRRVAIEVFDERVRGMAGGDVLAGGAL
jgi:hypothetical protein